MLAKVKGRLVFRRGAAVSDGAGAPPDGEAAGGDAASAEDCKAVASSGAQSRDGRHELSFHSWVYHERQVGALCAVHSLNNLLQGPYFDENSLRAVTQELDQAERALMEGGQGLDEGNARTDGYFNVQVMQVLLERLGLSMQPFRSTWPAPDAADPAEEVAFILNRRLHWFTVLQLRGHWFDLNSRLPRPRMYQVQELRAQLSGFLAEGWTAFVIRGDFETMWGIPMKRAPRPRRTCSSCTARCCAFTASFVTHWFDQERFDPTLARPLDAPPDQQGCWCPTWRLPRPQQPPADDAPEESAVEGDEDTEPAPPKPPPPKGPPNQAPPQLNNINVGVEPDSLDKHFRIDQMPDEEFWPRCPQDHPLEPLGLTRDNGWTCDSTSFKGGCRLGIRKPKNSRGVSRFRCHQCNYDICEECYSHYHEPVVPPPPKRRWGQRAPVFSILEPLLGLLLWIFSVLREGSDKSGFQNGGLERLTDGLFAFALHHDCDDIRAQVWRWLTYRFSHENLPQCLITGSILLLLGIPLETFHGWAVMFFFFNLGVAAGAASHGVFNGHDELVGFTAVCYTFIGMHLAHCVLNWRVGDHRCSTLIALLFAVAVDVVPCFAWPEWRQDSPKFYPANRLGGLFVGLLLGLLFGRSLMSKRRRRLLRALALLLLVAYFSLAAGFIASSWPPRLPGSEESEAWCWRRQLVATNASAAKSAGALTGSCVRCADIDCIGRWSSTPGVALVACGGDV